MISKKEIEEMKKRVKKAKKEGKSMSSEDLASEVEKILPPSYDIDIGV